VIELVAPADDRLDVLLAARVPDLSRSQAQRLIREGRVTVGGAVEVRPSARVTAGARITLDRPPPVRSSVAPEALPVPILHQDEDLAVVDKPAGMAVHPGPGHPAGTLVNALLHHLDGLSGIGGEERPGIVHRLDRGTSGLLVVAKHDRAHRALAGQFAAHTAGRTYLALVHDPPREDRGTVTSHLARHPRDRVRFASTTADRGRRAVTHWEVVGRAGTVGLVRCTLETGRTHQIRVHLSELGAPLVGDGVYRRRRTSAVPAALRALVDPSGERPLLHAWRLGFDHPTTGRRMQFEAPPPPDFRAVLDALGLALP